MITGLPWQTRFSHSQQKHRAHDDQQVAVPAFAVHEIQYQKQDKVLVFQLRKLLRQEPADTLERAERGLRPFRRSAYMCAPCPLLERFGRSVLRVRLTGEFAAVSLITVNHRPHPPFLPLPLSLCPRCGLSLSPSSSCFGASRTYTAASPQAGRAPASFRRRRFG